jgi:hypothetical protein
MKGQVRTSLKSWKNKGHSLPKEHRKRDKSEHKAKLGKGYLQTKECRESGKSRHKRKQVSKVYLPAEESRGRDNQGMKRN